MNYDAVSHRTPAWVTERLRDSISKEKKLKKLEKDLEVNLNGLFLTSQRKDNLSKNNVYNFNEIKRIKYGEVHELVMKLEKKISLVSFGEC